jgi:hypothetical protein
VTGLHDHDSAGRLSDWHCPRERFPAEFDDWLFLIGPSTVQGEHQSRSGYRIAGWVLIGVRAR